MTGIVAVYSPFASRTHLRDKMLEGMDRRARDGIGKSELGRVALGACNLHTTVEAIGLSQPLAGPCGHKAIVFDGFLTNYRELFKKIEGLKGDITSGCDAELVLLAYELLGEECLAHLEGEYAFVIADSRNCTLLAARDHASLRPLFYLWDDEQLLIASDLEAIAQSTETYLSPNIDQFASIMANSWHVPGATVWNEILSLPPANCLMFKGGQLKCSTYWTPDTEVSIRYQRDEEYVEHYQEMLIDSVQRCARTHKPLAIAVSGGLDSSSLLCVADQLEAAGLLPAPSIQAYSLAGIEGTSSFELNYARKAADYLGRSLIEVPLFRPSMDWFTASAHTERNVPIPTNGAMTIALENRVVDDGSVVFLNGDGGDEWLQGGYQHYRQFIADRNWRSLRASIQQDIPELGSLHVWSQVLRQAAATLPPETARNFIRSTLNTFRKVKSPKNRYPWLKPELRSRLEENRQRYVESLPRDPIDWIKYNLLRSPFSDFANSMMQRQRGMNGLESRHPMQTRQFIEFSLKTPEHIKRRAGSSKFVHRQAFSGILHPDVLRRTTKADFESSELDQEFASFAKSHAKNTLVEFCELDALGDLLAEHSSTTGADELSWEIWGVYAVTALLYKPTGGEVKLSN